MSTMTLLKDATEAKKFDTRVVERNLSRGVTKAEDVEKTTKDLQDDSANAEYIAIETLAADPNVK